jgi:hypothetical protein
MGRVSWLVRGSCVVAPICVNYGPRHFGPDCNLWLVLATCRGFMGPGKPSSLVTTLSNHTSLLWGGLLEGEWGSPGWRPGHASLGANTSSQGQGPDFNLVGTLPMIVVRETPGATRTMCQSGSSPAGCISTQVIATLSDTSDRLFIAVIL